MFYSSEPFKNYSASQDREVPLSAILGTWKDTEVEMFFNPTLYDEDDTNDDDEAYAWQDGAYTVSFTFEISEDLNSLSLNYEYFTYSYWNLDTDAFAGYSNIIMYGPVPQKATTSSAPASVVRGNARQDKAVRVKPAQEKLPQVFAKRK